MGENAKLLLNTKEIEKNGSFYATDINTFKDVLFIVSNDSKLYQYNITSAKTDRVEYVDSVTAIGTEWITEKLYWADLKKQIVSDFIKLVRVYFCANYTDLSTKRK